MLIPVLALAVGILSASFGADGWVAASEIVTGSLIYLFTLRLSRNPLAGYRYRYLHQVWLALWFCGIGIFSADLERPFEMPGDNFSAYKAALGHIRDITATNRGDRVVMDVRQLIARDGTQVNCPNFQAIVNCDALYKDVDDVVIFPASFRRIRNSVNSFDNTYAERMARRGFLYRADVTNGDMHLIAHRRSLNGVATSCRDVIVKAIENTTLSRDARNFLITVLAGDRDYLTEESRQLFANTGIAHVLALSGMHVAIIAGIFLFLLFPLNYAGLYKLRLACATSLIFVYAFVTGGAPSTIRACVMAAALAFCIILERRNTSWNSLLLAMAIILFVNPYSLFDVGLQMSFACVASLLFFVNPLNPIDHRKHPYLYKTCAAVLCSLVTTLCTWAISAYYFHRFPLMFLPVNLVVLPLLPVFMAVSIAHILLVAIGLDFSWLSQVISSVHGAFISFVSWMETGVAGAATLRIPVATLVLWSVAIVFAAMALKSRWKKIYASLAAAAAVVAIVCIPFMEESKDEMIICDMPGIARVRVKEKGQESEYAFPVAQSAVMRIGEKTLAAVDRNEEVDDPGVIGHCDYLLVSGGYKGDIETLVARYHPAVVVTHPSIRKKREAWLIHQADSLGIPIHSLRRNHPLRICINE